MTSKRYYYYYEEWNDINYKEAFMKLHDVGWKKRFSTSALVMDVVCLSILNFSIKS